jgi:cellobiose phosphorylase
MGRGGLTFLTGSTAMGLRAVYDWMLGIKPQFDGLAIDPCIPSFFKRVYVCFHYRGKKVKLEIVNCNGAQVGVKSLTVNNRNVFMQRVDSFSGRNMFFVPDNLFKEDFIQIRAEMN